ncbi:hypothetical protein SAMN04488134_109124 [Amphibacillus marinus]|uniref:VanZ like family protein n=2 Tax=Amphibacillus marinus TaxID=872970 RepID=A0A1H8R1V0_9BACI|nr:hypothetical protein SAMN04488134_109124 [Amphibacillus marinus]
MIIETIIYVSCGILLGRAMLRFQGEVSDLIWNLVGSMIGVCLIKGIIYLHWRAKQRRSC